MKNRKFWQGFLTGGLSVLLCMLLVCAGLTVTGKIDIRNMIMKVSSGSILNKKLDSKMTELQAYIDQFFLDDIDRERCRIPSAKEWSMDWETFTPHITMKKNTRI